MKRQRMSLIIGMVVAIAGMIGGLPLSWAVPPVTGPGDVPDYYQTPNWAISPPLAKFVDPLPKLWNPLNPVPKLEPAKCLAIAVPDKITYPGSDYYEIELREYAEKMHRDLPPTTLRGYVQVNLGTNVAGTANNVTPAGIHYAGPLIIATKDRPVRIRFTNALTANSKFFLPVDTTLMGTGTYHINFDPQTNLPADLSGTFSENRADIHLHGGRTPWISDGTPYQWITPAGETTSYSKGASVAYVPDMWFDANNGYATIAACAGKTTCTAPGATNDAGPGSQTYYHTNEQSARLMFYHDHAEGITRLNVYAGEVAGYLVTDPAEQALITAGDLPADQIPLIIQDKTFVDPATITKTDPTWAWGTAPWNGIPKSPMTPVLGDLWWPHVYMPAQNPYNPDLTGINAMGRWHYGPWFWPPTPLCSAPGATPPFCIKAGTIANPYYDPNCNPALPASGGFCQPPEIPGTPNPSWGAEAFLDTMVVNGAAYPRLAVQPRLYRFRVLNGSHDRFLNLQLYQAANKNFPTTPGPGTPVFTGPLTDLTEVRMVNAITNSSFPATWPTDNREGGVPIPTRRGPAMIQIGSEGGFLPAPVLLKNQPISWNLDPTTFNVGNVLPLADGGGTLILGPAERADILVDFTNFAGKTLILYNDAPTAYPALDPHYDYYTGAPDRTDMGGSPAIPAGVGPNNRTVMQIVVSGTGGTAPVDDYNPATLANLDTKFKSATGVFATSQQPIIVGQTAYNATYGKTFPATWPNWGISRIGDNSISFMKSDGVTLVQNFPMKPKAIHDEMGGTFDDYGRMAARLGLEVPFANAGISTFALQNYVDPPTEITADNQVQIWKFTHNGVDTHPVHFHLFEVQVINRVGWDGFIRLPDINEIGWKETVRMSPLEDTIVALRAIRPRVPFAVPDSIRPLNPTLPLGSTDGFSQIDPLTGNALASPTVNALNNYGHEYVYHCHILSHEENDMMRPLVFNPNAKTEVLLHNTATGENKIWYMDGITSTGEAALATNSLSKYIAGSGDFDNDGIRDYVVRDTKSGKIDVWIMKSNGKVKQIVTIASRPIVWTIGGVGDFNGDGKPDILWRDTSTGNNDVWLMNGTSIISTVPITSVANLALIIAGVGDFNNDGKPDILWRNTSNGNNMIWFMNGTSRIGAGVNITPEPDQNWKIVGTGDFNNNVYTDIFWRNSATGANRVWFMNGKNLTGTAPLPATPSSDWILSN